MKFPYGMCDFQTIRAEQYYYVDRTGEIPALEDAGKQLLFLRPRRFGKSLLLSMLENYYDVAKADQFEALFGQLAIGQVPTVEHNQYFVLKWDFSAVSPQGTTAEIKQNLHEYLNVMIRDFSLRYQALLPDTLQISPDNALVSFQSLLSAIKPTPYPLYLLIDEYDNFANEVLMRTENGGKEDYQALLFGEGAMKALFKVIKSAAAGQGLARVFITGVSPVVMSDITSGYNVAENIYLLPQFNALCGFRQAEISHALHQVVEQCELPADKAVEAQAMMQTFYNGYHFSVEAQESIYNPTLALYFLKALQRDCKYPQQILDSNLAMDRRKIQYISNLPDGQQVILDALAGQTVSIVQLADRFGVEDMRQDRKDRTFMVSLLYYFGVLTMAGKAPFAEIAFTIPNLVICNLYAERIRDMLLPENASINAAQQASKALFRYGDMQPLCDFVATQYFKVFHNRDYAWSNELTIKTAFLTLLFNDTFYIMESEATLQRAYADLTMIVRPDMREYGFLDILIEFKYVSLKDAGLRGEQLEHLSPEKLTALPAVQEKQQEARVGLARYQEKLADKFGDVLNLHSFSVISVGFERLVFEKMV